MFPQPGFLKLFSKMCVFVCMHVCMYIYLSFRTADVRKPLSCKSSVYSRNKRPVLHLHTGKLGGFRKPGIVTVQRLQGWLSYKTLRILQLKNIIIGLIGTQEMQILSFEKWT